MKKLRLVLKALIMVTVFGSISLFVYSQVILKKNSKNLESVETPRGGEFTLNSENGPVELKSFSEKYLFLYFGYTYCPDICPTSLGFLSNALKDLKIEKDSRLLFVTVDPERDTLDKMKDYMSYFPISITPLRGSVEQTEQVVRAYGGYFRKEQINSAMEYAVDHSAKIYFINNKGKIQQTFNHGLSLKEFREAFVKAQDQFQN